MATNEKASLEAAETKNRSGNMQAVDQKQVTAQEAQVEHLKDHLEHQGVEAEIAGLRKILDDLNLQRADLQKQIETYRGELIHLKKNHEEDLLNLRTRVGGQVNVEVDAAPQQDLPAVMSDLRENVAAKSQKDLQGWFQAKSGNISKEDAVSTESIQSSRSELAMQQGVEADIVGLRKVLDDLILQKSDLEMQIENYSEELIQLKRNHEEVEEK